MVFRLGNYLVVLFLVSKLFYISNAVGQLFLLSIVLATKYYTLGFEVASKLARRQDWTEESYVAFPRVTLCDFKVLLLSCLRPHRMHIVDAGYCYSQVKSSSL